MAGIVLYCAASQSITAAPAMPFRIGLVTGEAQETVTELSGPLTSYLSSRIPAAEFQMVRIENVAHLLRAAEGGQLDFAFCTPAAFVSLASLRTARPIATIVQPVEDAGYSPLTAAAIFVKSDRADISALENVRGKRVVAFDALALGGWLAAAREWRRLGIDPQKDLSTVRFINSYEGVASAVCSGGAEAGVLPAGALAAVRRICPAGLRILPPPRREGLASIEAVYPGEASTPAYPEMAFAVVGKADERLVARLSAALLSIEPGSAIARAVGVAGFTAPMSYEPVANLMRELRVGPFESYGRFSLFEAAQQHWFALVAILMAFATTLALALARARRLNSELEASEAFRKRVFEGSRIPLVMMDAGTLQFIDCNDAAARIYGLSNRSEVLACKPGDLFAPTQADGTPSLDKAREYVEQVLQEGMAVFDWRCLRPNGQVWDAEIHLMRFRSGSRTLLQYTVRDITVSRRLEERVRLLAQALHDANDCISICDRHGTVIYANRAFLATYGYDEAELLGHSIEVVASKQTDSGAIARNLPAMLEGGWRGDLWNCAKDGREFPVSLTTSAVLDDHGGRVANIWCVRDMTEYRALQSQYLSAQKLEGIGRLAGGIAHDFNNLLTIVMGYSRMMLGGISPGHPFREPVQEISDAANRAADLTRQLLTFSRRQPGAPRLISINDPVLDIQKMLRRVIGEDVEVTVSTDAEPGFILADPSQIEQILVNLAVNARDAMPEGGRLLIETSDIVIADPFSSLCLSAPMGNYVKLTVSDTGSGMTQELQERIFEPFFTTKAQGKGTGLGLSTVYGIVKQSGGYIGVHSAPNLGAAFRVLFPAMAAPVEQREPAAGRGRPLGSGTVLLVEDESGVRKYIQEILEIEGYHVLDAANGQDAIELARRYPGRIRLLLTDSVLPGMNGIELAERIRAMRPAIAVLRMSGYTDRFGRQSDEETPFIQKPFTPDDLFLRIADLLREPADPAQAVPAGAFAGGS